MDTELEKLYLEWEQEEIDYQNYLNSQIYESKKVQKTFQELRKLFRKIMIQKIDSVEEWLNFLVNFNTRDKFIKDTLMEKKKEAEKSVLKLVSNIIAK